MKARLGVASVTLVLVAVACGDPAGTNQALPPTPTVSVSPLPSLSLTPSPSPSSTAWKTYSNTEFGFTIEYPGDFRATVQKANPSWPREGMLLSGSFVAQKFPPGEESPGDVELGVYVRDAASVEEWIAKHSGAGYGEDTQVYYDNVSNQRSLTVGGHPAIAFDWVTAEGYAVHAGVFFLDGGVFELTWNAHPAYASTLEPIFERMLDSYTD